MRTRARGDSKAACALAAISPVMMNVSGGEVLRTCTVVSRVFGSVFRNMHARSGSLICCATRSISLSSATETKLRSLGGGRTSVQPKMNSRHASFMTNEIFGDEGS